MRVAPLIYMLLGLLSLGFGIWILTDASAMRAMDPQMRTVFGVIVIMYGLFRIYTAIKSLRNPPEKRVWLGSLKEEDKRS